MDMTDFSLNGRIAIVTGTSRGIGEAIARGFAELGATVVLASRKQEDLDRVADSIKADGCRAVAIACHIGNSDAIRALFERVEQEFGRVDILVNNAATNPYFGPAVDISESALDKTIEVNIKGYFMMSQCAAKMMVASGGGSIINIASVVALRPGPLQVVYSMTKAAVVNMTKGFAKELGSAGVRVNAIAPGIVETRFSRMLIETKEIHDQIVDMTPLRRHAQPSEMVGAAVYLASEASSFTTGSVLVVDGGFSA